jgi:hypothetical protein
MRCHETAAMRSSAPRPERPQMQAVSLAEIASRSLYRGSRVSASAAAWRSFTSIRSSLRCSPRMIDQTSPMGTMFASAPIVPTVVEVRVLRISFDALSRYCERSATTSIRPVEAIGSPMVADLYVCAGHAEQLVTRARAKGIDVAPWPPWTIWRLIRRCARSSSFCPPT